MGIRLAGLAVVSVVLTAGLVLGSRVPWVAEVAQDARIRLSWKAVGEPVEECRVPSEAELASLPVHMRRSEICERRLRPFRLSVRLDGEIVLDETIVPAGARGDRPVTVFHEFRAQPGPHHLAVRFEEVRDGLPGEAPPPLVLDAEVALAPREILLVTREGELEHLAIRQRSS